MIQTCDQKGLRFAMWLMLFPSIFTRTVDAYSKGGVNVSEYFVFVVAPVSIHNHNRNKNKLKLKTRNMPFYSFWSEQEKPPPELESNVNIYIGPFSSLSLPFSLSVVYPSNENPSSNGCFCDWSFICWCGNVCCSSHLVFKLLALTLATRFVHLHLSHTATPYVSSTFVYVDVCLGCVFGFGFSCGGASLSSPM